MNTKRASRFAIKRATDPKPRAMACKRCTTVSSNACASSSAPHSQTTHCARSIDSPPPIFNTNVAQTGQSAKPIITRARCVIALALCNPSSAYHGRRVGRFCAKVAGASNESRWKKIWVELLYRALRPRPRSNDGMLKSLRFFLSR